MNQTSLNKSTRAGALSDAVGGGALALDGALNIAIDPTCLEGRDEITLATATGGVSGTPTLAGNVPSRWMLAVRSNNLVLKKINGTVLIVR